MTAPCADILAALKVAEALKRELRHSWLSDGRRESVAEHSWNMALLAMFVRPHLEHAVDFEKTLRMIIIHDLVEAEAGDIPFFETGERRAMKQIRESEAMRTLAGILPQSSAGEIETLWREFEAGQSSEARLVKALDHLEVQIQHNLADFSTWEPIEYELVYTKMDAHCAHDSCLRELCSRVKAAAERKMQENHVDVDKLKKRLKKS